MLSLLHQAIHDTAINSRSTITADRLPSVTVIRKSLVSNSVTAVIALMGLVIVVYLLAIDPSIRGPFTVALAALFFLFTIFSVRALLVRGVQLELDCKGIAIAGGMRHAWNTITRTAIEQRTLTTRPPIAHYYLHIQLHPPLPGLQPPSPLIIEITGLTHPPATLSHLIELYKERAKHQPANYFTPVN